MRKIDLEPRKHSHMYEIKPMSRWWFVFMLFLVLLSISANGLLNPISWSIAVVAGLAGMSVLLCFPRKWLSKLD